MGRNPDKPIGNDQGKLEGVAALLERIREESAENPELYSSNQTPATETLQLQFENRQAARKAKRADREARQTDSFDPNKDASADGDPYKTLFISRLSKDATEEDLRREFAMYGHIENLRIVRDVESGKSKGYAFVLFEREKDMKAAYKDAEGVKILGKRILVDVERGRTVKGWKPMRLGGGLGGRPKPVKASEEPVGFFGQGGGFKGGAYRGRAGRGMAPGGFREDRSSRGGRGGFSGGRGGFQGDSGRDRGGDRGGDFRGGPRNFGGGGSNAFGQPQSQGQGYPSGPRGGGVGFDQQSSYGGRGEKRDFDGGSRNGFGSRGNFERSSDRGWGSNQQSDSSYGDRDSKRPRY